MSIGPRKHQIASFPATNGRRHEYHISTFHKVHYYLLLSHSKLTPRLAALMRASKTDLSAVVAYSAYSGTRTECQNDHDSNCAFCNFIDSTEISIEIYVKWS